MMTATPRKKETTRKPTVIKTRAHPYCYQDDGDYRPLLRLGTSRPLRPKPRGPLRVPLLPRKRLLRDEGLSPYKARLPIRLCRELRLLPQWLGTLSALGDGASPGRGPSGGTTKPVNGEPLLRLKLSANILRGRTIHTVNGSNPAPSPRYHLPLPRRDVCIIHSTVIAGMTFWVGARLPEVMIRGVRKGRSGSARGRLWSRRGRARSGSRGSPGSKREDVIHREAVPTIDMTSAPTP